MTRSAEQIAYDCIGVADVVPGTAASAEFPELEVLLREAAEALRDCESACREVIAILEPIEGASNRYPGIGDALAAARKGAGQ